MANTIKSNNTLNNTSTYLFVIKWGSVVLFILIAILIYYFLFYKDSLRYEHFVDVNVSKMSNNNTIYEKSLNKLYFNNPILLCNLLPTLSSTACVMDGVSIVKNKFPVHMIKLIDGSILAVFNDGRLYSKNDILNTLWDGPLDNSLIGNITPLRMITLNSDVSTLLGIGYDNKLYSRDLDTNGSFDSKTVWKPIANNSDIIYVIFDRETHNLVSIDINGKLFIKPTTDLTSKNQEINNTTLDRPLLRLYYDMYGYMLAIDDQFQLYQFIDKNWKTSGLNLERGSNKSKLHDIIYYNDGKLLGLVLNEENDMLISSKQSDIYYLSPFIQLSNVTHENTNQNFMLTDSDVIQAKIGYINPLLLSDDDTKDDDASYAYNKQSLETQSKLRNFCKSRYDTISASHEENYELLSNVEKNNNRISQLKDVLDNIIKYDPEKQKIQESYPNLYPVNSLE